jgi:hypothetical protein
MTKISQDINYRGTLDVFNCRTCHQPQIMDGCNNPDCEEYYKKTERYKKECEFFNSLKGVTNE